MRIMTTTALAGLAVGLALAHPATAIARPASQTSIAAQLRAAQQQMAQMQAQINALQARIDAQQAASPAPAPEPAAAQAQALAADASARADKALAAATAAQAAAGSTQAAQAKADKKLGAMAWAADTKISGRVYLNASTLTQRTAGGANVNTGTGLNIKRVYLGVDHRFSDMFAMNVTTDISNVVGRTATDNQASATATNLVGKGLYVKKAYLEARIDPALWVRIGAADLPWVPFIENHYGYRHVENILIDRTGFGTSADWGIHVGGDLLDKHVSWQLSAINGAGYRNVKVSKSVDFEGRISGQWNGMWAALGGYVGKRGNAVQTLTGTPNTFHTAHRLDAALGYKDGPYNIGAEYFYAKDWNSVAVAPGSAKYAQDSAQGWQVFGTYAFKPKWSTFAKYEWAQPNRIAVPDMRDRYFNVGVQYEPVKIVDLALVYKRETVTGGALSTSNGVIGCATTATSFSSGATCAGNGTYDEFGLWAQLRF